MEHGYQLATGKSAAEEGTLTAMANLQSADRTNAPVLSKPGATVVTEIFSPARFAGGSRCLSFAEKFWEVQTSARVR